jgi:hypothetical protein
MLALIAALAISQQTAPTPPDDAAVVPVAEATVAAPEGVGALPALPVHDDKQLHTVLSAWADVGRNERFSTAIGAGALGAGLIGAGITYYAVANADTNLSTIDAEDTEIAGIVIGAAAVVPAAVMVSALLMPSPEEQRLAAFEEPAATDAERQARATAARQSLEVDADAIHWLPIAGGAVSIAGGLGAAGLGAYFLLLPHLPDPRGPITHSTGAELIGGGVAALGLGIALIAGSGSTAQAQLELLDASPR